MTREAGITSAGEVVAAVAVLALASALAAGAEKTASIDDYVQAINQAESASAAIDAYAAGLAADSRSVELREAYLRRMIQFGRADVLENQARALLARDADNAIARAVLAFVHASRGQMGEAFDQIAQAADKLPDDPFVQYTAGQLVGWYDWQLAKAADVDEFRDAAGQLRAKLGERDQFTRGHTDATEDLDQRESQADESSYQQPARVVTSETYIYTSPGYYGYYGYYPYFPSVVFYGYYGRHHHHHRHRLFLQYGYSGHGHHRLFSHGDRNTRHHRSSLAGRRSGDLFGLFGRGSGRARPTSREPRIGGPSGPSSPRTNSPKRTGPRIRPGRRSGDSSSPATRGGRRSGTRRSTARAARGPRGAARGGSRGGSRGGDRGVARR